MTLIIAEHYDNLAFEVLETEQGSEVILTVDPAVRETYRAANMIVIEFFLRCDTFTSHIQQDHVLLRQLKDLLKSTRLVLPIRRCRALPPSTNCLLFLLFFCTSVIDLQHMLCESAELFLRLASQRSFV